MRKNPIVAIQVMLLPLILLLPWILLSYDENDEDQCQSIRVTMFSSCMIRFRLR